MKAVKVEVDKNESIWIEAVEVSDGDGRAPVAAGEVVANLATVFDQMRSVFEVGQTRLVEMLDAADETVLEIGAKLTTSGRLLIVEGSAEGTIKVTMKWKKPKSGQEPARA